MGFPGFLFLELLVELERKQRLQIFAEWNYLHNWKERKDYNYLLNETTCRNGNKENIETIYWMEERKKVKIKST